MDQQARDFYRLFPHLRLEIDFSRQVGGRKRLTEARFVVLQVERPGKLHPVEVAGEEPEIEEASGFEIHARPLGGRKPHVVALGVPRGRPERYPQRDLQTLPPGLPLHFQG